MPQFHQTQVASLCVSVVMLMLQTSNPSVLGQSNRGQSGGDNAALLSVLDPDVAYENSSTEANSYSVQQASFQEPGIVSRATTPPRANPSVDSTAFPYQLTAAKTVAVRSGPSETSYATDHLQPGESVLVYRHDPDGWLAIRPPEGSFSLVRAKDAQKTGQPNILQIVNDKTKAWVGTRVEQTHQPMTQVRLKVGERVAVQSTIEVEEGNGRQLWLQIDPPAGEFRWVHISDFRQSDPDTSFAQNPRSALAYQQTTAGSLSADPAVAQNRIPARSVSAPGDSPSGSSTTSELQVPPLELADTESEASWRAAQRETPELGYSDYGASDAGPADNRLAHAEAGIDQVVPFQNVGYRNSNQQQDTTERTTPRTEQPSPGSDWDEAVRRLSQNKSGFYQESTAQATSTNSMRNPPVSANAWNQHMTRLNQQLSQEIVKPAEQWSLAPLLQQSQSLIQSAPSSAQRDAAATMQKRILGFLQLQKKQPGNSDLTAGTAGARYASAGNSFLPASTASPVQQVNYENPYAAVGYLKELIIDRGKQPNSYVLQDITGKTLCHISPLPGVQLHQYLDQKIGVKGKPGYHAQLRLPHVSVEMLDRLE